MKWFQKGEQSVGIPREELDDEGNLTEELIRDLDLDYEYSLKREAIEADIAAAQRAMRDLKADKRYWKQSDWDEHNKKLEIRRKAQEEGITPLEYSIKIFVEETVQRQQDRNKLAAIIPPEVPPEMEDESYLLHEIESARAEELAAHERIADLVKRARDVGITWRAIASAAGISHTAAHKRWSETGRQYNVDQQSRMRKAAKGQLPYAEPLRRQQAAVAATTLDAAAAPPDTSPQDPPIEPEPPALPPQD